MKCIWNLLGFRLREVLWVALMLLLWFGECLSLNHEGLALLEFRAKVDVDPHGALKDWNSMDNNPCSWSGVRCIDGKVETLNLKELSLRGTLAPELGKLSHLRSLVLYKNNFSGVIPKEIGQLSMLELLDLRGNTLSGTIPTEIGEMISLRHLLLCGENFQSPTPTIEKLNGLSELQCDQNLSFNMVTNVDCMNRKVKHCQQSPLQQWKKANSIAVQVKEIALHFLATLPWLKFKSCSLSHGHGGGHGANMPSFSVYIEQNGQLINSARRKLLQEESSNLAAVPINASSPQEFVPVPSFGSGAFPAVPNPNGTQSSLLASNNQGPGLLSVHKGGSDSSKPTASEHNDTSHSMLRKLALALPVSAILAALIASAVMLRRKKGPKNIGPWKTGLSGPLQKAFVAGVQKLQRTELEAACEDFSNIISSYPVCTVYKGTLSSGVEIAVVSTAVTSKDWSKRSEAYFRKKLDTLSRINHKNFTNLLGFCEENEPFTRMVVLEYAPNGTLYEHLHSKDLDHLDWSARMRIIMGTAYCLQYLHHELNPSVVLGELQSKSIYLTDDYAAKVSDRNMWREIAERKNKSMDEKDTDPSDFSPLDPGSSLYSFGIIMLETISGKLPHSEEEGSILNWATEYLNDKHNFKNLVDPALKSFKNNELEAVCEAIQECIHGNPKDRPKMREIAYKLGAGLGISPEAAYPRLSPLWWAELEILSVEAS